MRTAPPTHAADAFGLTTDPSSYFPRAALEVALAELVERIGESPACAALIGEPGLGKTLLLHVLEERLEGDVECLYVPFPRLEPAELWSWIAVSIGLGENADARAAVLEHARRRAVEGTSLLLLVDDAGALPPASLRALLQACGAPGFSLVMAFTSADLSRLGGLPRNVHPIELGPPMTPAETRAYVRARLRRVDPEGTLAARLGPARMAELHEASAGVPARLHALLDAWLRTSGELRRDAPPAPAAQRAASEPPAGRPAGRRPPPHAAIERQPFFRGRRKRRVSLSLAFLLVLLLAGFWRFAALRREPAPEPAPAPPAATARELPALPEEQASVAPPPPTPESTPPAELAAVDPPAPAPLPPLEPEPAPAATAEELQAPEVEEPVAPPPPAESAAPEAAPADRAASPPGASAAEAGRAPAAEPAAPPLAVPQLAPAARGPRLSVNAEPWARIQLDGKPVGETPLGELSIAPGSHVVTATLPDGRVLERRVEAKSGDLYVVFP